MALFTTYTIINIRLIIQYTCTLLTDGAQTRLVYAARKRALQVCAEPRRNTEKAKIILTIVYTRAPYVRGLVYEHAPRIRAVLRI